MLFQSLWSDIALGMLATLAGYVAVALWRARRGPRGPLLALGLAGALAGCGGEPIAPSWASRALLNNDPALGTEIPYQPEATVVDTGDLGSVRDVGLTLGFALIHVPSPEPEGSFSPMWSSANGIGLTVEVRRLTDAGPVTDTYEILDGTEGRLPVSVVTGRAVTVVCRIRNPSGNLGQVWVEAMAEVAP